MLYKIKYYHIKINMDMLNSTNIYNFFKNCKNKIHKNEYQAKKRIMKIHGKYYDLTNYEHPGGPIAMMAANGRDATALFESHHQFSNRNNIYEIMKKYEIRMNTEDEKYKELMLPGEEENYNLFDWKETLSSEFTLELRDKVYKYFDKISKEQDIPIIKAIKANNQKWFEFYFFGGMTLLSFYHMIFSMSGFWSWINVVLFPVFYWLSGTMLHDGSHFAISNNWRVNWYIQYLFYIFSSPYVWLHQHVIGHHSYTNIDNKDPDLHHSPELFRYKNTTPWIKEYNGQEKTMHLYWPFAVIGNVNIHKPIQLLLTNYYNYCVYKIPLSIDRQFFNLFGRLCYIYIFLILPFILFSFYEGIKFSIIPNMIYSILFILNAQLNHFQDESIHSKSSNWFIHQIISSNDFGGLFHYYASIGLNYQIEHHLFPSVNSCHYANLQKIILGVCFKYGVNYNYREGYIDSLQDHFNYMKKIGTNPQESIIIENIE